MDDSNIIIQNVLSGLTNDYKANQALMNNLVAHYEAVMRTMIPRSVLEKIRAEIKAYGSIWVKYFIKGHTDRDIELLIEDVLRQAKEQILDIIDKYTAQEGEQNEIDN